MWCCNKVYAAENEERNKDLSDKLNISRNADSVSFLSKLDASVSFQFTSLMWGVITKWALETLDLQWQKQPRDNLTNLAGV